AAERCAAGAVPGLAVAGLSRTVGRLAVPGLGRGTVPGLGRGTVPGLAVRRLAWCGLTGLRCTVSRTALAVARLPLAVAGLSLAVAALRAGRSRGTWRVRCVGVPGRGHGRT